MRIALGLAAISGPLMLGIFSDAAELSSSTKVSDHEESRKARKESLDEYMTFDRVRTGSHRIAIAPKKHAEGIATGAIMVYGHPIQPPYHVERIGNRILINGIQVQPSLVRERQEQTRNKSTIPGDKADLNKKIGSVYREAYRLYAENPSTAGREVQNLMAKQPAIFKNVEWNEKAAQICFVSPRIKSKECWGLRPWNGPSTQELSLNQEKIAEQSRNLIEHSLRLGKFVVFDSRGQFGPTRDFREEIHAILRNPGIDRVQKIEKVKEVVEDYGLALDVVDNYSNEEWSRTK